MWLPLSSRSLIYTTMESFLGTAHDNIELTSDKPNKVGVDRLLLVAFYIYGKQSS